MGEKKDFFISYNSKQDTAYAVWIEWLLRKNNYTTIMQEYDFRAGDNFKSKMHHALLESERVVLVLSRAYMESENCEEEWTNLEEGQALPILIENFKPKGLLKSRVYINIAGKDRDAAAAEILEKIKVKTRPTTEPAFPVTDIAEPPFPRALMSLRMPSRNPNFTGRGEIMRQLGDAFASGEAIALTQTVAGLGGVGKTQIALEYAYRNALRYDVIWWCNADNEITLQNDYRAFALRLGLVREDANFDAVLTAVLEWFDRNDKFLFIYDNVEDFALLEQYRPRDNRGNVIITTRSAQTGYYKPLDITPISPEEAVEFLNKRIGRADADAGRLAERLGCLPLALEQAGAYIATRGTTCGAYLKSLEKGLGILDKTRPLNYKESVTATWELSFAAIERESARQLLNMCAYLAPDDIPLEIFRQGQEYLLEPLKTELADELDDVVYELTKYSLAARDGDAIRVHRLVQEVVREKLGEEEKEWLEESLVLLIRVFSFEFGNIESHAAFARNVNHATAVADWAVQLLGEDDVLQECAGWMYNKAGFGYSNLGDYKTALQWHEKTRIIFEKTLGTEHHNTAAIYNNIGIAYKELGEYQTALEWYEKDRIISERVFGTEHHNTAAIYNNIGSAYELLCEQSDCAGVVRKSPDY
jgi:tetratricopeptide (TPR) repeat protein